MGRVGTNGFRNRFYDMEPHKSALERAFEIARSGEYPTVDLIIKRLNKEGYNGNQVNGRTLVKQLDTLIWEAENERARRGFSGTLD